MRLVFFGTSEFAVPTLERLAADGNVLPLVVTNPARPAGRGRRLQPSPVEAAARRLGMTVTCPVTPNDHGFVEQLRTAAPDIGVLVAYGGILHDDVLKVPRLGFINLHPSLLPAYRGAAPIQRALMDGIERTGVSVIAMSRAVDAGDILRQDQVDVLPDETGGELSGRLASLGAAMVAEVIARYEMYAGSRVTQDQARATLARKISKADRIVDWRRPALAIHNQVRALSPEPGAVTGFRNRRIVLLRSRVAGADRAGEPGLVMLDRPGLVAAAARGAVELLELKPEGGRAQTGQDFRNGNRLSAGERFS